MPGKVLHFENKKKAWEVEQRVIEEAKRIGKEAITEIEYQITKAYPGKPYALYYEFVDKEENPPGTADECPECAEGIAAAMTINICNDLENEHPDCEELSEKLMNGEMEPLEVIQRIEPYIKDKEHRAMFETIMKEARLKLKKKSVVQSGQTQIVPTTILTMPQSDEVKDKVKAVIGLVSFFTSWNEVVDRRAISDDKIDTDQLYEDVIGGKIPPSEYIKKILPYVRNDNEDALSKKEFLEVALLFTKLAERGEDVEKAFEGLRRIKRGESYSQHTPSA